MALPKSCGTRLARCRPDSERPKGGPVASLADLREATASSTLEKDVLRVLRAAGRASARQILLQQKVSDFFSLDILIKVTRWAGGGGQG
eukprot:Skav220193  [mRNA]  locus=scaffold1074:292900:293166:- [translate_table: standard]